MSKIISFILIVPLFILIVSCGVVDEEKSVQYSDIQGYWVNLDRCFYPYLIHPDSSLDYLDTTRPRYYMYYSFHGPQFSFYEEAFMTCNSPLSSCSPDEWIQYMNTYVSRGSVRVFEVESQYSDVYGKTLLNIFYQRVDLNDNPVIDNQEVSTLMLLDLRGDTLYVAESIEPTCERAYWESGYSCISTRARFLRVEPAKMDSVFGSWVRY